VPGLPPLAAQPGEEGMSLDREQPGAQRGVTLPLRLGRQRASAKCRRR
jgi:hypothetical protein